MRATPARHGTPGDDSLVLSRRGILRSIADLCRLFTPVFLVPVVVSVMMEEPEPLGAIAIPPTAWAFLASAGLCVLFWAPVTVLTRTVDMGRVREREGYLAVAAGWLLICVFASLPFLFSGVTNSLVDAYFEGMSGLTTTGATAFATPPEELPPSIVFWRALLNWIGGLGIVVLLVALIAGLTQGGSALMRAEAPTHVQQQVRPRLRDTARAISRVYVLTSAGMVAILYFLMVRIGLAPGDAFFDAVIHSFSSYSTGGFTSRAASIGHYNDVYIEAAIILFMLIGATQFVLFLGPPRRLLMRLWQDTQWRFFIALFVGSVAFCALVLAAGGYAPGQAVREAAFAVATTLTGTGLYTTDFGAWHDSLLLLLLVMMLTGGNAGSTAGAIKTGRLLVLFKAVSRDVRKLLYPRAAIAVHFERRALPEDVISKAVVFFFAYVAIWLASSIVMTAIEPGFGILDGAAAAASTLGNVGVGLGATGPSGGYAALAPATKALMTVLMWVGRLEIFTAVLLFTPASWRH